MTTLHDKSLLQLENVQCPLTPDGGAYGQSRCYERLEPGGFNARGKLTIRSLNHGCVHPLTLLSVLRCTQGNFIASHRYELVVHLCSSNIRFGAPLLSLTVNLSLLATSLSDILTPTSLKMAIPTQRRSHFECFSALRAIISGRLGLGSGPTKLDRGTCSPRPRLFDRLSAKISTYSDMFVRERWEGKKKRSAKERPTKA